MENSDKALLLRVSEVLHYLWNPIGLGIDETPEARDEYDQYALEVFQLLKQGASENDIVDYLQKKTFSLSPRDVAYDQRIAEILIVWRDVVEEDDLPKNKVLEKIL